MRSSTIAFRVKLLSTTNPTQMLRRAAGSSHVCSKNTCSIAWLNSALPVGPVAGTRQLESTDP